MFKVPEKYRYVKGDGALYSDSTYGNNGLFRIRMGTHIVYCVASDGEGFEHVSVSIDKGGITPTWAIMARVKDLFWDAEDTVVQFHPPKSMYVNLHPHVLHLWRNEEIQKLMIPPKRLVGI